jgi:16S rRNA (cytidine1402-2'-O)-methyltransferase
MSLMASGFNGQSFAFNGYLPIDNQERNKSIKQLEQLALQKDQTQLFIETPYRNNAMFDSLVKQLQTSTNLCIACDISLANAFIKTAPISYWRKNKPELHKRPCMFIIGK